MIPQMIGIGVGAVTVGAILWGISLLELGLEVDNFWWAVAPTLLISGSMHLLNHIVPDFSGSSWAIISILLSVLLLLLSVRLLRGLRISNLIGALLSAAIVAIYHFGIGRLLLLFG